MKYIRIVFLLLASVITSSCNDGKVIQEFSDDFQKHEDFWIRNQVSDSLKAQIVKDPATETNSCLKITLTPQDINAGSRRNEYVLKTLDSIGFTAEYSFKFMFPPKFFKQREKLDWIIVHQWHDEPPRGVSWSAYKEKTKPPVSLAIHVNVAGDNLISYTYGLGSRSINERKNIYYSEPLKPNVWYSFSNIVRWSLNANKGYSIPKINNEYLIPKDVHSEHKLIGENMYNDVPNYYKMGLYGNTKSTDTISVFIDDFRFILKEDN